MIDGIQFTYHTSNPNTHLLGLPCWKEIVWKEDKTSIDGILSATIRGLDIKLKPSLSGGYKLFTNGSLHKFHNCGEHNADQFTAAKLLRSLDSVTDIFQINAGKCTLHGIEIGVNIILPFSPIRVLKNLVSFQSRPFTQINKRSLAKGYECALSQYRVKVYDKAKQSGVDCGNVLRFEVSVDKMQALKKYKLSTLADLYDLPKVYSLIGVLKDALNSIIWKDSTADLNRLTDREQKQWLFYSNPTTWGQLSRFQRTRALKKWGTLLSKYGNIPDLLPLVLQTWERLFSGELEAENPQHFYQPFQKSEAEKSATFLPLVCTVKTLHPVSEKHISADTTFLPGTDPFAITETDHTPREPKRFCPSCKRDISHQRKQTIYCSEKLYGKAAKRCRNKSSNRRRDIKRKINSAMKKNVYLLITYTDQTGRAFSDVLHPSEIDLSGEWLNQVQSITAISFKQEPLKSQSHAKTIGKKVR